MVHAAFLIMHSILVQQLVITRFVVRLHKLNALGMVLQKDIVVILFVYRRSCAYRYRIASIVRTFNFCNSGLFRCYQATTVIRIANNLVCGDFVVWDVGGSCLQHQ